MGAGKTSVGRRVAARLERPLLDCDEVLAERTGGRTAADIAEAEGAERLHELEAEIALDMVGTSNPAVIGPAASVIEVEAVRDALAGHFVVWLTGPVERLASDAASKPHRPFLEDADPLELLSGQMAIREPLVLPIADLVVDVYAASKDDQAEGIVAAFAAS
ncbi:MAG: shikimate kinase [Acidimicrobiales bacterium]